MPGKLPGAEAIRDWAAYEGCFHRTCDCGAHQRGPQPSPQEVASPEGKPCPRDAASGGASFRRTIERVPERISSQRPFVIGAMLRIHRQGFFAGERLLAMYTGEEPLPFRISTKTECTPDYFNRPSQEYFKRLTNLWNLRCLLFHSYYRNAIAPARFLGSPKSSVSHFSGIAECPTVYPRPIRRQS